MNRLATFFGLNAVDPNAYEGWGGALAGCVPDATDLAVWATQIGCASRGVLSGYLGARPPYELRMDTTRGAWRVAHRIMADIAQAGDTILFGYSGHGGQYPTLGEPDLNGETFCFCDGQLYDAEQNRMLADFKPGVDVVYLLDCCHAGGLDRAREVARPKCAPRRITPAKPRAVRTPIAARILMLCACRENETALDGDRNGAFTGSLLAVWENTPLDQRSDMTWAEWFDLTSAFMGRHFPAQHPTLRELGPAGLSGERILA